MADWIHCNQCFRQPGNGNKFSLTNCGHMFCEDCTKTECSICKSACTTIPLSSKMAPDVELFFTNPNDLASKYHKKLMKVLEFQRNHRERLFYYKAHKMAQLSKSESELKQAKAALSSVRDIERENAVLKEENLYLRKLLEKQAGGGRTPPMVPFHRNRSPVSRNSHAFSTQYNPPGLKLSLNSYQTQTRFNGQTPSPVQAVYSMQNTSTHDPAGRAKSGSAAYSVPLAGSDLVTTGRVRVVSTPPIFSKSGQKLMTPSPKSNGMHTPGAPQLKTPLSSRHSTPLTSGGTPMDTSNHQFTPTSHYHSTPGSQVEGCQPHLPKPKSTQCYPSRLR